MPNAGLQIPDPPPRFFDSRLPNPCFTLRRDESPLAQNDNIGVRQGPFSPRIADHGGGEKLGGGIGEMGALKNHGSKF